MWVLREIIGVYEPARAALSDGTDLPGSWLTLRSELQAPGAVAMHESCHQGLRDDAPAD